MTSVLLDTMDENKHIRFVFNAATIYVFTPKANRRRLDAGEVCIAGFDPGGTTGFALVSAEHGDVLSSGLIRSYIDNKGRRTGKLPDPNLIARNLIKVLDGVTLCAIALERYVPQRFLNNTEPQLVSHCVVQIAHAADVVFVLQSPADMVVYVPRAMNVMPPWKGKYSMHVRDAVCHALCLRERMKV